MPATACPICGKPVSPQHKPFCSRGCVDRDLLQWLGEGYRLPAGPATGDEEASKDTVNPGLDSDADDD
ncbi:MAG: DNA gyrase inhibitor YacG [Sphingomonas sp.]|uniref:DNA gyrase inhibitor YacG n=1 Tax=Sphingomonas sp. TaxID=28214 RepID=UPI0025CF9102|nr:DNA gyrase inhibitor YacG [Sphingomonas sp.]MBY0284514.1 DNA gyrase inhibitor YacG [Sphingomonas sp.]